jgi:hypothetical protein
MISTRTYAALAAAKARGVILGGPRLTEARKLAHASTRPMPTNITNVLPIIREVQKSGATSLRDLAQALNARGVHTARSGHWYATSVKNVLERTAS